MVDELADQTDGLAGMKPAIAFDYQPPTMAAPLVRRAAIEARLSDNTSSVQAIIGAPGGGKTCAMSSYAETLISKGEGVLWFDLTTADNDCARLDERFAVLGSEADYVFVDGLHRISSPEAQALLDQLLFQIRRQSRIVVAARHLSGPEFHAGLLSGQVELIGPDDLRASDAEAAQILGGRLSRREIERINLFVDGWVAGLRMLSGDLQQTNQLLDEGSGLTAVPAPMAQYFDDVVCSGLAPDDLAALLDISVFERFSSEALVAMPGPPRSWLDVEELVRQNLFLRFSDQNRLWVTFQPAFGRHLRHRLRLHDPQRYEELRAFAATWFGQQGFSVEAVRHAVALTNRPVAAQIIEAAGAISVDLGHGPDVSLDEIILPEAARDLPLAFLGQVYYRVRRGRQREARQLFDQACALTENFTRLSAGANPAQVADWHAIMVIVFKTIDDLPLDQADIDRLETAMFRLHVDDPVLAASLASLLAFVYLDLSRYAEASTICDIGMSAQNATDTFKATIFIRLHQASAALAQDTLAQALLCLEDAVRLASIGSSGGTYETVTTQIMRAVLHYENNELKQALALFQSALVHLHAVNGWVRLYAEAYTLAAEAAFALRGADAAEKLLRAGESFARQRNLPRLTNHLAIARLSCLLREKNWRAAQDLIERQPLSSLLVSQSLALYDLVQQVPAQIKAAQLLVDIGRPRQAQALLDQVNKQFLEDADNRIRLTFHLLTMRAAFGSRRFNAAFEHMQNALELARQSGLVRRMLDEQDHVLEVYDWSVRNGRHLPARIIAYVKSVLRPAEGTSSGTRMQQNAPRRGVVTPANNFALSPRESEIMALIAEGLSAKEIANRLEISEGTVKSHRKKIHEKLGVSTRSQAIQRARELLIV